MTVSRVQNLLSLDGEETPEFRRELEGVASDLESKRLTLLALVEQLGPLLTHSDDYQRARGVQILAQVVEETNFKSASIEKGTGSFLLQFFLDRLKDPPSVGAALDGILALLHKEVVTSGDEVKVPEAIFQELTVQSHSQPLRNTVYRIFVYLMTHQMTALKAMSDFVPGFVNAMDGEKDPRNLLICFGLIASILSNFDGLQAYVDELFEVVFCYFPITFRAPPDDPHGISAEDLKRGLRDCLAATPLFAEVALPLLLEKLASSSTAAKRDSLDVLCAALPVYGAEAAATHADAMWDILKLEILDSKDDDISIKALAVLNNLVRVLSVSTDPQVLPVFLDAVLRDTMDALHDLGAKNARVAGSIFRHVVSGSDPAAHQAVERVLPTLLERYTTEAQTPKKRVVLVTLDNILVGCNTLYNSVNDLELVSPIMAYKDRLFELFRSAAFSDKEFSLFRLVGIEGLQHLCEANRVISTNEISLAIRNLTQLILYADEVAEVRAHALAALKSLSSAHVEDLKSSCFDTLFSELDAFPHLLDPIAEIATHSQLFHYTLPHLLQNPNEAKLDALLSLVKNVDNETVKSVGIELIKKLHSRTEAAVPELLALIMRTLDSSEQTTAIQFLDMKESDITRNKVALFGNIRGDVIDAVVSNGVLNMIKSINSNEGMIVASVVNKMRDEAIVQNTVEDIMTKIGGIDSEEKVRFVGWIINALVLRSHPYSEKLIDSLICLLEGPLGKIAAETIGGTLYPHALILNPASFATSRILYKQKFFVYIKPKLVTDFIKLSPDLQSLHLLILSGLLRDLPKRLILSEIESLLPLLFAALTSDTTESSHLSTLKTFSTLLAESPDTVNPHITSLISALLKLITPPASIHVRIEALRVLYLIPEKTKYELLHPLKRKVIKALITALDDKKRLVRKEAVKTRGIWDILGK